MKIFRGGVQLFPYNRVSDAVARWNTYEQVICMRFHSLVLSILATVPALPVAYGSKTSDLAKDCGLDDYLVCWNTEEKKYFGHLVNLDENNILTKFCKIKQDREKIIHLMNAARQNYIISANTAFSAVLNDL